MTEARRRLAESGERFAKTASKALACLEAGFKDVRAVMAIHLYQKEADTEDHTVVADNVDKSLLPGKSLHLIDSSGMVIFGDRFLAAFRPFKV